MPRYSHLVALLILMPALCVGCCTTPPSHSLEVTLRPQETSMWCWAASGEMCMDFLGTDVQQCDEANKRFGHTDCCNKPVPRECIKGGWPEFEKYGFTVNRTLWGNALSWDDVKRQIYCSKKPFCFSWGWPGGGGHMMVAYGYVTANNERYVLVNNPWEPNVGALEMYTYDYFVSLSGHHTHWRDYYNINK